MQYSIGIVRLTLILVITFQSSFGYVHPSPSRQYLKPTGQRKSPELNATKALGGSFAGQSIQSNHQDPEISKHLRTYDLIKLNPAAAATQIRENGKLNLSTTKHSFDLQLSRYDLRSSDYVSQATGRSGLVSKLPKEPVEMYKGSVLGSERAQARITVRNGGLEGAIITPDERFFIQPARSLSRSAKADEFVVYEASDLIDDGSTCAGTLADEVATRMSTDVKSDSIEANSPISGLSPLKIVRIATDADAEYVASLGGAAQANTQIMSILNMVDGIYQVQIGITFQIVFQNTWLDAATDPYTSTSPGTMLSEFRNHWNANFTNVQRNLTHLWTGKDLDSTTIGLASLASVCRSPQSAYGLSQRFPLDTLNPITAETVVLTAHEIGHNFGAVHTNEPNPNVPPDLGQSCEGTIMLATIGAGSGFCPFSRSQIIGHAVAYGSCLSDSSIPAPSGSCVETPITGGVITSGDISATGCESPSRGPGHFADRYTFNATSGQQIVVTMNQTSGNLNPYLYLIGPDGFVIDQADFGNGTNARIPEVSNSGVFTLPQTGRYVIEATSSLPNQTGNYALTLTFNSCTLSATPTELHFPASGGTGTLSVTTSGPCSSYQVGPDPTTAGSNWVLLSEGGGSGARTFSVNASKNNNASGRRMFLLIGPSGGNSDHGGLRVLVTQSGNGPDCSLTPINVGQTVNGTLSTDDCQSPIRGDGFYADRFSFVAAAGQQIAITLSSSNAPGTDTFLTLMGPNGAVILTDDDSGGLTNSRIPGGLGFLTLGLAGTYVAEVGAFGNGGTGPYTLTLSGVAAGPVLQFASSAVTANENSKTAELTVTRTGNTAGTATVDYQTMDSDNFLVGCADVGNNRGGAFARCDFATSIDTLTFAPGETSKSFSVPLIDDSFAEGNETFTVILRNPNGATLGNLASTTVTINDNETVNGLNPIFTTPFFVRQHYLDFLSREPEAGEPWTALLNNCSDVNNDPSCDRLTVSAAFFGSPEFQLKGYYVYRFYRLAFDRLPSYREMVLDMRGVTGQTSTDVFQKKAGFATAFVQRSEFASYNALSNASYVSTLMGRYNLTKITTLDPAQPDGTNKLALTPADLTDRLNAAAITRAQALRAIADSDEISNLEFSRAFVAMQYYGYLRRTPDEAGLNAWLNYLNTNPTDFRTMVNGFMNSPEYRLRFGPQ